MSYLNVEA